MSFFTTSFDTPDSRSAAAQAALEGVIYGEDARGEEAMSPLDHKELDTIETETDEAEAPGAFIAVVSSWSVDRTGDRILRGAFRKTLDRWRQSEKTIPVLSDHDGEVGAVVGYIDPRMTFETEQGLEAGGVLDLATALGRRVYELVKKGSLSWSIGYRIPQGGQRRRGKVNEITEIDLAEVSIVAVPANADTRTLSIKSHQPVQVASFPC